MLNGILLYDLELHSLTVSLKYCSSVSHPPVRHVIPIFLNDLFQNNMMLIELNNHLEVNNHVDPRDLDDN